jgi:membrane protein YqaA with SNARE-associated domain
MCKPEDRSTERNIEQNIDGRLCRLRRPVCYCIRRGDHPPSTVRGRPLLATGSFSPAILVLVASVGNVLGSIVNWALGRGIERFRARPWFPARPTALNRATGWYRRYGRWSLLLSWVPVIGDPLTVVAGVLREPLWSFVAIVAVAKVRAI